MTGFSRELGMVTRRLFRNPLFTIIAIATLATDRALLLLGIVRYTQGDLQLADELLSGALTLMPNNLSRPDAAAWPDSGIISPRDAKHGWRSSAARASC